MRLRPALDGCDWEGWISDDYRAIDVWVHVGQFGPPTAAESEMVGV